MEHAHYTTWKAFKRAVAHEHDTAGRVHIYADRAAVACRSDGYHASVRGREAVLSSGRKAVTFVKQHLNEVAPLVDWEAIWRGEAA